MKKESYKDYVKTFYPPKKMGTKVFRAFIVGGLIGVFAEFLIQFYSKVLNISAKAASTPMIVTLIAIASFLTGFGVFDKIGQWAGAGTIIPITGFANSMTSAALEHKREGLVYGIGTNMFKLAGTVIVYGVVSAYIFGIIRYFVMGG